ncbi:MAG: Smr/MutS family protein [Treponema sp.]|jgi:DNA-nicking Smr family endonuclease|nr:Smr/MutS family protein [Treponema sp.]
MDFGDILDKWEKGSAGPRRAGVSKKEAGESAPAAGNGSQQISPLEKWLRINGVYDKDAEETGAGRDAAGSGSGEKPGERRRRLLAKKPDAVIDIHGLTGDEAWEALERFFADAKHQSLEKLLVIHGKGNHSGGEAVLKRRVREFVERCPFAGENGHGSAAEGGSGATWVLLK